MSAKVFSKVLDDPRLADPTAVLAMAALADWSDDDGRCWRNPRMRRIAARIRRDKRTAQRVVQKLIDDGFLIVLQEGGGIRPNVYQLYPHDPVAWELPVEARVADDTRDKRVTRDTGDIPPVTQLRRPSHDIAVSRQIDESNEDDVRASGGSSSDFVSDEAFNAACEVLYAVKTIEARKSLSYRRKIAARTLVRDLRAAGADVRQLEDFRRWWLQDWRCHWNYQTKQTDPRKFQLPSPRQVTDCWAEALAWADLNAGEESHGPEPTPAVAKYTPRGRRFDDAARTS